MKSALTLILCAGTAAPAAALPQQVMGVWCFNNNQERMFVDEFGFGFNDHTVCDTENLTEDALGFTAELACKNAHQSGEETVFTDPKTLSLAATYVSANLMTIQFSAEQDDQVFVRCDQ